MPPVFIPRDLWQKFQGDAIDQQGKLAKENIAAAEPLPPPEPPAPPWTPPAGTPSSTVESPDRPPPLADVMATAGLAPAADSAAAPSGGPPPLQDLLQRAGLGGAGAAVGQTASSIGTTAQNAASGVPPPLQDLMRTAGLLETPAPAAVAGAPVAGAGDPVMAKASQFLGQPYVWGGKSPTSGFDCSGLAGYLTTGQAESTTSLYAKSAPVDPKDVQPGDLVFYNMGQSDMHLQHVGTALGGGKLVQAGGATDSVNVADVNQPVGSAPEFRRLNAGAAQPTNGVPAQAHLSPAPSDGSAVSTTAGLSGGGDLAGKITARGHQILSDAANTAAWLGDQGQKALQAVLVTEGGLANARGDNGRSAGPLQFFEEGQLANIARHLGFTLQDAKTWVEQNPGKAVEWAIGTPDNPGYLGKAIQAGLQKGLQGAALATYAQQHGQVSVSPERAGANYDAMFAGGGGAVTDQGASSQTTDWGALAQKGTQLGLQGQQLTDWINQQQLSATSPTAAPEAAAVAGLARNRAASDATVQAGRAEQEAASVAPPSPIYHGAMIDAGSGGPGATPPPSGGSPIDAVKQKFNDALDALGGLFNPPQASQPAAMSAAAPAAVSIPAAPISPSPPNTGDQQGDILSPASGGILGAVGRATEPARTAIGQTALGAATGALGAVGSTTEPVRTAIANSPPGQAAGEFFVRTGGPSAEYPTGGPWAGPAVGMTREMVGTEQLAREFEQRTGVSYADFETMGSNFSHDVADGKVQATDIPLELLRLQNEWNNIAGGVGSQQAGEAYGRAPAGEQAGAEALGSTVQGLAGTALAPGAIGGGAGGIARAAAAGVIDPGSLPFLGVQGASQLAEPAARALGAATRGVPPAAGLVAREGGAEGPVINGMTGAIAQRVLEAHNAPIAPEALQDAQRTIDTLASAGGRVTGAPPQAQTAEGLAQLRQELTAMAQAGASQKDWYADSSKAILEATQGNPQDAERLAQLVAIYSPNTPVSANMNNALTAWYQWKAGQPISVAMKAQDERASKLLYDGVQWDGRKTNNFYRNLMQYIDPQVYAQMGQEAGQSGVTADIWMMRGFGYPATEGATTSSGVAREFLKAPSARQYDFIQSEVTRVAQQLGWSPEQVQAAIWTAAKSGSEGSTVEGAGYHYGHAIAERSGQVSWEASPGATAIQDIPGYSSGTFAQKQAFHDATAQAFLDEQGHDIVAQKYGLLGGNTFGATGVYRGEISPGAQTKFALPQAKQSVGGVPVPGAVGRIQEDSRDAINAYAATRGLLLKQDAVPWTRIFKTSMMKTSNAAVLEIGRALTPEEAATLDGVLTRALGPDEHAIVSTERGAWVLNLGDTPNASFQLHARNAAEALQSVDEARVAPARYDSEYIANDWTTHPNGEGYRDLIGRSGRAEQFGQLEDTLTQRIRSAQAEAARQNGWSPAAAGAAPSAPGFLERAAPAIAPRGVAADLLTRPPAGDVEQGATGTIVRRAAIGATGSAASESQQPGATPESVATAGIQGAALGAGRALVGRSIPGIRIPAEVGRIAQAIGGPPGSSRAFDLQKLSQMRQQFQASQPPLVQAATKVTRTDRFIGYTAANMLSGVGTAIQNTLGNFGQTLTRPVITAAAGYPSDAMRDVAAMTASLSDAFAAYGRTFVTGQKAAQHYQTPVGSLKNPLTYPLRNLGATDEFFRTLNSAGAAAAEASRRLRENPSLTFDQVLQRHTNDIVEAAADGAARAVYEKGGGTAGWFGEWVASNRAEMLRSTDRREWAAGMVLQWLMPMTRVPGVILGEAVRSLPVVNEVRGLQRTVQLARSGDTYAARQEAARTYLTSFANFAILSEVAQGNITGDGPTNPSDRQRLLEAADDQGNAIWRPNSIRVGGKWIDYAGLGPLALPMSSIANGVDEALDRTQKPVAERGGPPEFMLSLANRQARTIGNAWYLKGLADVLSGIKEGTLGGTGSSLSQVADRLVPGEALLNEIRKVEDMYAREPSSVLQREASRIPFASRTVPPRLSATTGQPLEQPEDWFSTLVRGTPSGMMTPNPVAAEVARLDEAGHRVSVPYDVKSYAGAKQTSDQQRMIHEQVGQAVNMYVLDTLGKANYAGLSDAQKADAVSQAVGQAQSAANISLGGQVARDPHESALMQWAQTPHYYGIKGTPEQIARKNWEVDQARAKLADYRKRHGEAGEARMAKEDKAAFSLTLKYEPLASEEVKAKKAKIDKATGGQLSQQANRAAIGGLVGVGSTTLPPQR